MVAHPAEESERLRLDPLVSDGRSQRHAEQVRDASMVGSVDHREHEPAEPSGTHAVLRPLNPIQ
jgi:hypothetical protein